MGSYGPFGHLQHKLWQKERSEVKLAIWLPTTKSQESTRTGACKWSATHHWRALEESYKFALNFIPIGSLSKKLWSCKVLRVQTGTISGLLLGSLGKKNHLDVGVTERHKVYYMGEGDGFPWVWAMVSLVSPKLPVACPNTKAKKISFFFINKTFPSTPLVHRPH